jgi:hypothetical protein
MATPHRWLCALGCCVAIFALWTTLRPSPYDAPGTASPEFVSSVESALARREYEASATERGLQAPNRAHNLRTYFAPEGVRVHDRTAEGGPALVGLALRAVGRADRRELVDPGVVHAEGARVEIRRDAVVEWYENSPAGLEQGFDLPYRPDGTGELALDLTLDGVRAVPREGGFELHAATGRRLRYDKLVAYDARGARLPARMEVAGDATTLRLVVDDAAAEYPLTIDPLLSSVDDTYLSGAQAGAHLGFSLASAGDVNGDGFADVIVGANTYDSGQADEGAAFVFHGSATGIADATATSAPTQLESNQTSAQLGRVVASAGDVNGDGYDDVIVGARFYDSTLTNEGGAFVFLGGASGVADGNPTTAAARLLGRQTVAQFGSAVASAGDVNGDGYDDVIVGAWFYDAPDPEEGAAFVFHGGPSGIANGDPTTAIAQLESNQADAFFGISVAGAGDLNGDGYADVIVGARDFDAGQTNEGAAFTFHGSASGIADGNAATAVAQLESNQASAQFGAQVSGAGDVNGDGFADVIVGAVLYDAGESNEGAAFVFPGGAAGVADANPASAGVGVLESNQANAQLGSGVRGAGDVNGDGYADVIVGAHLYDDPEIDEGAVFLFLGGAPGIPDASVASADARIELNQAGAALGFDVASAGDVNGDGFADLLLGASLYDDASADSGAAFVFLGGNRGIASAPVDTTAARLEANQDGAWLGWSVAGAGDVNADGYSDVIVAAPLFDSGEIDEGAAFVFLGSPTGIATAGVAAASARLESNVSGAHFGWSVASAGDVNGDGYGDVIVGAPQWNGGGAAFVFVGGPAGVASGDSWTAATRLLSDQDGFFGYSVAGAGDVDGDGYGDVLVGAHGYGLDDRGAAFVFRGRASGIPTGSSATADTRLTGNAADSSFGFSVAGAGDVDGDGYSDIVIGAPLYSSPQLYEGAAFVFRGSSTGIAHGNALSAATTLESNDPGSGFARTVAGVGDLDGDGLSDLAVGCLSCGGEVVFLYRGNPLGVPGGTPGSSWRVSGASVAAAAGDVNGDGIGDLIVTAGTPDLLPHENPAFVFLGDPAGIGVQSLSNADAFLGSTATMGLGSSIAGAGDVNGDGFADLLVGASRFANGQPSEGAAFIVLGNGNRSGRTSWVQQWRSFGDFTSVAPLGLAGTPMSFVARSLCASPFGRVAMRTELEACPAGSAFGTAGCLNRSSLAWAQSGSPGGDYQQLQVAGLTPGVRYRWRARTLYARSSVALGGSVAPPKPAHGPWRRIQAQVADGDLRTPADADLDDRADAVDNCPFVANPGQEDGDTDGIGNACDNCPANPNADQANYDLDALGDACDADDDNDGLSDVSEPGYGTNPLDADSDDDGALDGAEVNTLGTSPIDSDSDDDAAQDGADNCPVLANASQLDADSDARGDACDNCRRTANFDQADTGGLNSVTPDGVGNVCQNGDWNGDGTANLVDVVIIRRFLAGAQSVNPRMPPEP